MPMNPFADLFGLLDRELWLVTARAGDRAGGCIATFVSQASLAPELPRVLVGLARHHFTWELIESSNAFAMHLLTEEQLDWVWRFGLQSGRHLDKLKGIQASTAETGSPILDAALGWLDCRVEARLDTGDRTVYLAEGVAGARLRAEQPLTVRRMLQLAPAEKQQALKTQVQRDSATDAAAILAWRRRAAFAGPS